MERILALDVGDKRIGVAVSDGLHITAQPLCVVTRVGWGPDAAKIRELAARHGARVLLVGLPLNMDGSEGPQAGKVRDFARRLEAPGLSVIFFDERLTTVTAERALIEGGLRREARRGVVDMTAAAVILQGYLDAQAAKKAKAEEKEQPMKQDENENVVELIGDDGEPVLFEHLMTLEHQGKSYVLLTPEAPETPDEEGSVVIMRIDRDEKGEDCYIVEEEETVLDAVFNRFLTLVEEEDEEDGEDEDGEDDEGNEGEG